MADATKDPRLKGMDVRFNGRTLRVSVFCDHAPATETEEAFSAFANRMRLVASGPSLRMAVVKGSLGTGGSFALELIVNTDEPREVLERRVARGIEHEKVAPAVVLVSDELEPVSAAMFWTKLRGAAVDQVAKERQRS